MILRPYQRAAIDAAYAHMRASTAPTLIVLPTGAGKSAVIATLAKESRAWNGRVLILSHVRELISQVSDTIRALWGDPFAPVGVYSAGLGSRDTDEPIICAGIQSVYRRGCELGRFDLVLIDECHLIPTDGEGMYRTLLETLRVVNPNVRLIGLTATDYRLDCGRIHGPGKLFETVCYEAGVRDLIDQGYLSKLRGKNGGIPDLSAVHVRGGEYIPGELEDAMADAAKVRDACREVMKYGADRKAWLVFCCGVKHANMVRDEMARLLNIESHDAETVPDTEGLVWCKKCKAGEIELEERHCAGREEVAVVIGDTPSDERADLIGRYKAKQLRCLVSVGVLTTGFDAPHVDLIVLLRPTHSPSLYCQMVGRGLRLSPGKSDCLVLDLAGVITEHGPVDDIQIKEKREGAPGQAPVKTCPQCNEIVPASALVCHVCGKEFPRELARHDTLAHEVSPLKEVKEEWLDVQSIDWMVHTKKKKNAATGKVEPVLDAPQTLRVIYTHGYQADVSEWVCFGHTGFARSRAEGWWQQTTGQEGFLAPTSALAALDALDALRNDGLLRLPKRLLVREAQFPEIIGREFHERPDIEPGADVDEPAFQPIVSDDEPPF